MGLFDFLFGGRPSVDRKVESTFKMLNGYTPRFTSYEGGIYESELIRAAINVRAIHASKLGITIQGAARPTLTSKLQHAPNAFQTWPQFLYRLSTIRDVKNTAFIVPVFDQFGEVSGIYAPYPERAEIVQYNGEPYLVYKFSHGQRAAIELSLCGIMQRMQFKDDFFGESNHALRPTLDLVHIQNQGIEEGVKSAATYRFMAKYANFSKTEDLVKERKRFSEENFASDKDPNGLLLFPNTYSDIKQIETKPFVVDSEQMRLIKENVFEYYNVNEDVLQNKAYGDAWSAFYEGATEEFAIQFSDVVTKMLYTLREQSQGNRITATSNRLQYMSNADKLQVSAQLLDRGIMSINDVREIWNLPPVEGGDTRIIRGEYYNADDKINEEDENNEQNA